MECGNCPAQAVITAFVEANLDETMGRCQSKDLKDAIAKAQEAFQNVCLTCCKVTNDNNPSNHGQTFYSLDSGHCQANSGKSRTSHSDDNEVISRADWIGSHASMDSQYYQDNSFRPYSGVTNIDSVIGTQYKQQSQASDAKFFTDDLTKDANPFRDDFSITTLPSAVEAIILKEMNSFAGLPALHKMLVGCLLEGINLSDFSRMAWLPKEIRSCMKKLVFDRKRSLKAGEVYAPVSPQTAHAMYQNICKKLPYMTVLARATKKRSKGRVESQQAAIKAYQAENAKKLAYLSDPESFAARTKPLTDPIKEMFDMPLLSATKKAKGKKTIDTKESQKSKGAYQQEDMFGSLFG